MARAVAGRWQGGGRGVRGCRCAWRGSCAGACLLGDRAKASVKKQEKDRLRTVMGI